MSYSGGSVCPLNCIAKHSNVFLFLPCPTVPKKLCDTQEQLCQHLVVDKVPQRGRVYTMRGDDKLKGHRCETLYL